ncbi:MAG: hypothetical protein GX417_00950 [Clostridiales bacterium]|nr:hypothetical protein [Clostridiales bacterium]
MSFFAPGWKSQNETNAIKSVRRIKDGRELYAAAREAPLASVRAAAIDRLETANDLMHLIRVAPRWEDKQCALSRLFQIEPLSSAWPMLETMDRDAVLRDKLLQDCLKSVALHDKPDTARRAVSLIGDQSYLVFLYERNPGIKLDALACITDQSILQELLAKARSQIERAHIAAAMRDPTAAFALARSTEDPTACVIAIRSLADKTLASEIMGQTLDKEVCTACAGLVDIRDAADERRLAILALCGPESVRREAESRLTGEEGYVGIVLHEGVTRFPKNVFLSEHAGCLCHEAIKRLSDAANQRLRLVRSPFNGKQSTEELRQWTDSAYLLDMITLRPKHYCTRAVCARLDELDESWVQKLDDRTIEAMIDIISSNSAEEKFDYAYIASALKRIYRQGRAGAAIAALRGRAVAHDDASSMARRGKDCHEDRGYTYFELDE